MGKNVTVLLRRSAQPGWSEIPVLVDYCIGIYAVEAKRQVSDASAQVRDLFRKYPWPGNIRELENVIRRRPQGLNRDHSPARPALRFRPAHRRRTCRVRELPAVDWRRRVSGNDRLLSA